MSILLCLSWQKYSTSRVGFKKFLTCKSHGCQTTNEIVSGVGIVKQVVIQILHERTIYIYVHSSVSLPLVLSKISLLRFYNYNTNAMISYISTCLPTMLRNDDILWSIGHASLPQVTIVLLILMVEHKTQMYTNSPLYTALLSSYVE